MIDILKIW